MADRTVEQIDADIAKYAAARNAKVSPAVRNEARRKIDALLDERLEAAPLPREVSCVQCGGRAVLMTVGGVRWVDCRTCDRRDA